MNRNLLIVGTDQYAMVAKDIADEMGCFERIEFLSDKSGTVFFLMLRHQ